MKIARSLLVAMVLALASAVPAHAASSLDGKLVSCAGETDNAKRLACYDAAVATISVEAKAATDKRAAEAAVLAVEKAKVDEAAKQAAFGAERLNRGKTPADSFTRLDAKVAEVLTATDGMAVILLDNGQLWRQTTGMALPPVRTGDAAIITVGAMGSFQIELVRQRREFKVKRVR